MSATNASATSAARSPQPIRFRGRSFLAHVLAPEAPLNVWFAALDAWARRSPQFFVGRPVMLDLTGLTLTKPELMTLLVDLQQRHIRVMGIEGTDPALLDLGMPPLVSGGREAGVETPAPASRSKSPAPRAPQRAPSLLIENPVRSGQCVAYPNGDVIVIGSVASGAEVMAGGSIHVYGTLRGRVIAGSTGDAKARVFCRKLEAELLAIDGLYMTADDMDASLRGRPVQAWQDGNAIKMAVLD